MFDSRGRNFGEEQQLQELHDDAFVFDIKTQKFTAHTHMQLKRAKHCSCLYADPNGKCNKLVMVAGGLVQTTKIDVFKKKKIQTMYDTDLVEFFDFYKKQWEVFDARLARARHSAAACELGGYIYVVGGHTVALPFQWINSIERCSTKAHQSSFDMIDLKFG